MASDPCTDSEHCGWCFTKENIMPKGGRSPRQKGNRTEYEVVDALRAAGVAARRVPLSGSGSDKGDVAFSLHKPLLGEVKRRADGFSLIYRWLEDADVLFLRTDHKKMLAVLPLPLLLEIYAHVATCSDAKADPPPSDVVE
jgi:hypothetical protein